jgi:hypothetical protein
MAETGDVLGFLEDFKSYSPLTNMFVASVGKPLVVELSEFPWFNSANTW